MSSVACGEPLSLTHHPSRAAVRLVGPTKAQRAVILDRLPAGAPVVIRHDDPTGAARQDKRRRDPFVSVDPGMLSGTQQAVLLVLMAEARPLRNPELATLGPKLDKPNRDELIRHGLIEVATENRTLVLELTDRGWATCAAIIGADAPDRPSGQGKALYTVLRALRRYFDRDDLKPGDVFFPLDDLALAGEPDVLGDQIEERVRAAYVRLAAREGGWVDLVRLRSELSDVSRHDLDAALTRMYRIPGVSLVPEENQKTLTAEDHAAAVSIGEQPKHLIAIEN